MKFIYKTGNGMWCPLAVGLDVPRIVKREGIDLRTLSEKRATEIICSVGRDIISGFTLNPISGVRGRFFTNNRRHDLALAVNSLIV